MVISFAEAIGTTGNDSLTGATSSITFALEGNDTLVSSNISSPTSFSDPRVDPDFLLGGDGDDSYLLGSTASTFSVIGELGRSGNDVVTFQNMAFSSLTFEEFNSLGTTHLSITGGGSSFNPTIVILNWKEFESFIFSDVSHTVSSLDALIAPAVQDFATAWGSNTFGLSGTEIVDTVSTNDARNDSLHTTTNPPTSQSDDDNLNGGDGNDNIRGLEGNDSVSGGGGNDTLNGNQGTDTVRGGDGSDSVRGGQDNDDLNGNAGNDTVKGDKGSDNVRGGQGDDFVRGGQDNDTVKGDKGNDTVQGDLGDDFVRGGQDNDSINGGEGNDTINGDKGNDTLTGGDGNDIFVFGTESGVDSITDFVVGTDQINVTAIFSDAASALAATSVSGSNSIIDLGSGNTVTIEGVTNLSTSDFV